MLASYLVFDLANALLGRLDGQRDSSISREGLDARDVASKDEVVNVVGAFVSFHRLKVGHVAHDGVFVENAVCTVDVSGDSSNL